MADVIPLQREKRRYFSLADLPQRGSVAKSAFGVGWWELDQIFKFYAGQFVVVTGVAGQGKSTFLLNCIAKMAVEKGVKSFLYVPENEGHLREKFKLLWPGNDTNFEHFCESQCFVRSAVANIENNEIRTMDWILSEASYAVVHDKVEIVMIDPWNELDRAKPRDMLLSDYIGQCLMMVKDFCRQMSATVIVVAHPTKAVNEGGGRTPHLSDIEGSMNWYNKCDNGLIVVRDPERSSAKVISAKVREIGAGKIGVCHFNVDPESGVFTPMDGAVSL